jgi:putative ABC transport system permease protein
MQRLLAVGDIISFILVRLGAGASTNQVVGAINEEVAEVTAISRGDLSDNDRDLLGSLFIAPINVMSTLGFLVGLAIIGLTMYTTTSERMRDFGVLKAIGAPNLFLVRTVVTLAAVLGTAGFLVGLGASLLAGPFIVSLVPDIGVTIRPQMAVQTLGAVMAMSLIGALLPLIRVARVDPLVVFRSQT